MLNKIQNDSGFTLIEIMMAVGIAGIFIAIVYNFMNFNFDFLGNTSKESDSFLQARIAMLRLTHTFEEYQGLQVLPYNPGQPLPIYSITGTNDPSPPEYSICGAADRIINISRESSGDLLKSGHEIAKNIKIAVVPSDITNPLISAYITITIEAFPDNTFTGNSTKLTTVIRLNRKRYGL